MLIRFIGDGDSTIDTNELHAHSANGTDFTLCGITMDGDTLTAGSFEVVDKKHVTCPACAQIIRHCRALTIRGW